MHEYREPKEGEGGGGGEQKKKQKEEPEKTVFYLIQIIYKVWKTSGGRTKLKILAPAAIRMRTLEKQTFCSVPAMLKGRRKTRQVALRTMVVVGGADLF